MQTKIKHKWWNLVVILLWLGGFFVNLVFGQPTYALGVGALSILPSDNEAGSRSWFVHVLKEGEEKRDEMVINNSGNEAVTVFIFPTGYTTEKNKIIKSEPKESSLRQEPGYWVELDQDEITIPSHSSRRVGFTIRVPENADVGEHIGGIFIQKKVKEDATKGTGVSIKLHIGAQMVLHVPGEIERSLIVSNIRHVIDYADRRALRFIFTLKNQGNVALGPVLDTELRGLFGEAGKQEGNQLQVISRNETKDVESKWLKSAPYFGRFVAKFKFHLGEKEQFNRDGTKTLLPDEIVEASYVFWLFPWAEFIYLLVGILMLYGLRSLWLYIIISRRLRTKTKIYKVVKNDTLTGVAAKFNIDPRILAKFNMMRWPYELSPDDELLIPIGRMSRDEWRGQSQAMLGNREILGGIFGHSFRRRDVHHLADQVRDEWSMTVKEPSIRGATTLIIEKGDTKKIIEEFTGLDWAIIAKFNRLNTNVRLRVGQELNIPSRDREMPVETRAGAEPLAVSDGQTYETIVVEIGDSREDIEDFAGVPWPEIAKLNKLKLTAKPKAGQELLIPTKESGKRKKK